MTHNKQAKQAESKKEYKNPSNECDNCPSCGAESEEFNICPKGCYDYCSDPSYHGDEPCDGSC